MDVSNVAFSKRALADNVHCGDQCGYWQDGGKTILCIVDGLGHGELAEKAANETLDYLPRHLPGGLTDAFTGCDQALRKTRGVALGVAVIEETTGKLTYIGVGNTRAMIVRQKASFLNNNFGIVGGGFKSLSPDTMTLRHGDLVVLFTDGVDEKIDLSAYDEALRKDVQRLADKILGDWRRETDDAAVLVFRYRTTG